MNCILHVGTEKTATTTIQEFLSINREKLLEKGFFVSNSTGVGNNRKLPVLAYAPDKRDDFTQRMGIVTDQQLTAYQELELKALEQEVSSVLQSFPDATMIFSSEHIHARLTSTAELGRLKDILSTLGMCHPKIIVYLRKPSDAAGSLYSTNIKCGGVSDQPPLPDQTYWNNLCNHRATLEKFASVFGEEHVVPRLFGKTDFIGGSIVSDFLEVAGVPGAGYIVPKHQNKSLSGLGIEILRRVNTRIPVWVDGQYNADREGLVDFFEEFFHKEKYVLPESIRNAYDSAFSDSNEWVRTKYFPNKKELFSCRPPGCPMNENREELFDSELNEIAAFISALWLDKQNMKLQNANSGSESKNIFSSLKKLVRRSS